MTKKRSTKRALLLSFLSLLMCVSMLIGSTYAWFTDSVTSVGNKIVSGTLKIDLELLNKTTGQFESIKESQKALFEESTLWEPGYTEVKVLKISNKGNLALRWVANFVSGQELGILADVIDVYVKEGVDEYPDERTDLDGWKNVGTVRDFVNSIATSTKGTLNKDQSANLGIALKMRETAGNTYQGLTLGAFDIKIFATQLTYEKDSFDDQYDVNADYIPAWDGATSTVPAETDGVIKINNAGELAALAAEVNAGNTFSGKTIQLANNINLGNKEWTPIGLNGDKAGFQGTFDGKGYTIYNLNVNLANRAYQSAGLFGSARNATIKDFKIVGATINNLDDAGNTANGAAVVVGAAQFETTINNVDVENATVTGNRRLSAIAGYYVGTITNCDVKNVTLNGVFDDLGNNNYDNCDKLGTIIAYSNGASTITNNTVTNAKITGYRDIGGIAGYATTSTLTNNAVKDVTIFVNTEHNYKNYNDNNQYDAEMIIGEGTANATNTAENVEIVFATTPNNGVFYDEANSTYYVKNAEGLKWVSSEVNKVAQYAVNAFTGKTVKLMGNIDLNGDEWIPIGDFKFSATQFTGTFDGQGYTVSNFKITQKTAKDDSNKSSYGFFGNVNGTIKNLNIDNASVSNNGKFAAVLVGRFNGGVIDNCSVTNSSVTIKDWTVGGLVAQYNDGVISNCSISDSTVTGYAAAGAIAGIALNSGKRTIENCSVNNCKIVSNGSYGGDYDKMFGSVLGATYSGSLEVYMNNCITKNTYIKGVASNTLCGFVSDGDKLYINGNAYMANGLAKGENNTYFVDNADGFAKVNEMMADKSLGKDAVINLTSDIDFAGKVWTPVDSHADTAFNLKEINGNGHTIFNLTINGQAMFRRFAGSGDVTVKDIAFDNATVNSNGTINTAILTVQTYQNVLLDNVDVSNTTITGGYKVAPLIATVYNESSSTITATLKNCDVSNTTVKATSYDFCTAGLVAFVYADNNDKIEFENCTVSNVTLIAPDDSYDAHAFVYTTGSESLYNEAEGVTVTNCKFEALA